MSRARARSRRTWRQSWQAAHRDADWLLAEADRCLERAVEWRESDDGIWATFAPREEERARWLIDRAEALINGDDVDDVEVVAVPAATAAQ